MPEAYQSTSGQQATPRTSPTQRDHCPCCQRQSYKTTLHIIRIKSTHSPQSSVWNAVQGRRLRPDASVTGVLCECLSLRTLLLYAICSYYLRRKTLTLGILHTIQYFKSMCVSSYIPNSGHQVGTGHWASEAHKLDHQTNLASIMLGPEAVEKQKKAEYGKAPIKRTHPTGKEGRTGLSPRRKAHRDLSLHLFSYSLQLQCF